MSFYAILVVQDNGDEDYLCDGFGEVPTRFVTRAKAQEMRDFMAIGMAGDVESIDIVPYPR